MLWPCRADSFLRLSRRAGADVLPFQVLNPLRAEHPQAPTAHRPRSRRPASTRPPTARRRSLSAFWA
eukprot:6204097-Pleurochrysis_carterae.AAC.2